MFGEWYLLKRSSRSGVGDGPPSTSPNVWPSSSAATKPLCDGTPVCSGTARIHASFELIAAIPSAQPWADPSLIAASTTPSTRSAWLADPFAAFHDWRNWPRLALIALKLPFEPPVPQKRPFVRRPL